MYLASSLEPSGPKSTHHYMVLNHENRRDLIKLPTSYLDLRKEVARLYHIEEFYIESKELNVCAGEKVRIPEEIWSDIASLLGNVHVVPCKDESALESHPESKPEPESQPAQSTDQGTISFDMPIVKEEMVVIHLGEINFDSNVTTDTRFNIQILNEKKDCVVGISIHPQMETTTTTSPTLSKVVGSPLKDLFNLNNDHHIVVCKRGNRFQILYDLHLVATIPAPAHLPLKYITYILGGVESPFKGPISANVYSSALDLYQTFAPYRAMLSPMDKERLYQQILACNPRDAAVVSNSLRIIRQEQMSYKHSISGIIWRSKTLNRAEWMDIEWNLNQRSICVINFTIKPDPSYLRVVFTPQDDKGYSLYVYMKPDKTVSFSEETDSGDLIYHTITLANSMHSPGDHTIVFFNEGDKLRVTFDWKQSTILPRNTMLTRRPKQVRTGAGDAVVVAEVFEFV